MSHLDKLFADLENVLMAIAALDFDAIEGMPRDEKQLYRATLVVKKQAIQESIDAAYSADEAAAS